MPIELIIDKRTHDLGGGFEVGRVLPFQKRRMVGPFIFFDQMGPVYLDAGIPKSLDVRPHPHIGLSTVTYLYDGAMTHRDSLGFHQEIKPGEVNWMVAGSGITHSERFEYARTNGANMFGIQAWVALPNEFEETNPAFYHHEGDDLPHWVDTGISGRLIAGAIDGMSAKVKTHSPLFYVHLEMKNGARHTISNQYSERAVFVARGAVEVLRQTLIAGQMAVLSGNEAIDIKATTDATIMILGGEPVGKRFMFWNFVASTNERLEQAKEDWKQGRMKLPKGDENEFIPLPE